MIISLMNIIDKEIITYYNCYVSNDVLMIHLHIFINILGEVTPGSLEKMFGLMLLYDASSIGVIGFIIFSIFDILVKDRNERKLIILLIKVLTMIQIDDMVII